MRTATAQLVVRLMQVPQSVEETAYVPVKICDNCGGIGSVSVSSVGPNRDGASPPSREWTLCRACARAEGIPLRGAHEPRVLEEPEPPSWAQVADHLRACERTLEEAPEMRDFTVGMAGDLWEYAQLLRGEMPPDVAAAFRRLGVGTT